MPPFFSIIIATYNRAELLPRAVESVLAQSFPDWELIVVDDGSTDTTPEVLARYEDRRIVQLRQENGGQSSATNLGIQTATGQYICYLDDDDRYLPLHLKQLHRTILANDQRPAIYRTQATIYGIKSKWRKTPPFRGADEPLSRALFFAQHFTGNCTCCIPNHIAKETLYSSVCPVGLDMHQEVRLALSWPIIQLPVTTCEVYQHTENSTHTTPSAAQLQHRYDQLHGCWEDLREQSVLREQLSPRERTYLLTTIKTSFTNYYLNLTIQNRHWSLAKMLATTLYRESPIGILPQRKAKTLLKWGYYRLFKRF